MNIYTLIALPPANHKSLVVRAYTQPLWRWEKEQKKQKVFLSIILSFLQVTSNVFERLLLLEVWALLPGLIELALEPAL